MPFSNSMLILLLDLTDIPDFKLSCIVCLRGQEKRVSAAYYREGRPLLII